MKSIAIKRNDAAYVRLGIFRESGYAELTEEEGGKAEESNQEGLVPVSHRI